MYLGGASFGGMVALELAALVKPRGIFLIGSCTSPRSITPVAQLMRAVLHLLPVPLFRPRRWMMPLVTPMFGRLTSDQRGLFFSMAERTPASFLKWGVEAILSWHPSPVAVPVHHIHGSRDRLIPIGRVQPNRVVSGGGHLLTLTHPEQVVAFLSEAASDLRGQNRGEVVEQGDEADER
jgi:pimeloyl-ACP methyl ester carboxylesterase